MELLRFVAKRPLISSKGDTLVPWRRAFAFRLVRMFCRVEFLCGPAHDALIVAPSVPVSVLARLALLIGAYDAAFLTNVSPRTRLLFATMSKNSRWRRIMVAFSTAMLLLLLSSTVRFTLEGTKFSALR